MDDLISRRAAIDALAKAAREKFNLSDEYNHYLAGLMDGEVAIRNLLSVESRRLQILAKALDGCPLTDPCDRLWAPEGWCKEHCGRDQDFPDAECWIKYAEVVANEER